MGRSCTQLYLGVRKGAWAQEEDALLTKCIEKYGEGNWRQVPLRSGLNRCRKCCRSRWMNYLSPNIKRGEFAPDEIDLIIRLHRLLGNRWSLIAGRIPGRTANDIKNYWNSHLSKKLAGKVDAKEERFREIIKPQPRTFNVNARWLRKDIHVNGEQQQRVQEPSWSPSEEEFHFWKNLFPKKKRKLGALRCLKRWRKWEVEETHLDSWEMKLKWTTCLQTWTYGIFSN